MILELYKFTTTILPLGFLTGPWGKKNYCREFSSRCTCPHWFPSLSSSPGYPPAPGPSLPGWATWLFRAQLLEIPGFQAHFHQKLLTIANWEAISLDNNLKVEFDRRISGWLRLFIPSQVAVDHLLIGQCLRLSIPVHFIVRIVLHSIYL